MDKLYRCYECCEKVACNLTGGFHKCIDCATQGCPFEKIDNYDTQALLCRKCTIEKAVPIFTFGHWIKGGCYHG